MEFDNLKNFMDKLTNELVPGNSISVYHKNKEVFRYSSGFSDVENNIKMTGEELLYIYSCSKVATVTAALQLLEQGKYLLSDPLYEYIPEFRNMTVQKENGEIVKASNTIKLWNLFTMTAGFDYNQSEECGYKKESRKLTDGKMDTVTVAKCLANDPLHFEPGEKWQYSMCHDVLAAFVEVVSGKKFSDYVRENIFEPVGMTQTRYHITPEMKEKMACQYRYIDNKNITNDVEAQINGCMSKGGEYIKTEKNNSHIFGENYDSGGAGIITTVPDYAKFAACLANKGITANGEHILSEGTIDLMRTNQLSPELLQYFSWQQLCGYGYGLGVRTCMDKSKASSTGSVGEFGWGGAAGATILVDPDKEFSFFYSHHMLNPQEGYYQPRLRNAAYSGI